MSELGFLGLKDDRITKNNASERCTFYEERIMRKYPKYKASGIEWIEEIPEHWSVTKVKFVATIYGRIGYRGYTINDIVEKGEGAITISPSNMKVNKMDFSNCTYISWFKYDESPEIKIYNGDILFVKTGSTYGKTSLVEYLSEPATINPQILVFKKIKINTKYFYHQLRSKIVRAQVKTSVIGGTIPTISQEKINNYYILLPEIEEQLSIVRFLDHKTGQMDRFIANRQKQIELLKEQKAGIINKAVIKGLNPKAKMKPSGIDWIGEFPEHWIVIRLKYIIKTMASGVSVNSTDEPAEANEYGVLKTSCVYTGEFNPNENKKIVESEYHRMACSVKANIIIISRMNTPELVGANGFVDKDYEGLFLPDRLWQTVFFKKAKIVPKWLSYFLSSNRFRTLLSSLATGTSASMKNITQEDVLGSFICLPPIEEQNTMVSYFEEETSNIDTLISKYQKQIDLMQEYRTSLISQAVTGKIDVRENV